jgi:uncharacterized protein (DUF2062 family)
VILVDDGSTDRTPCVAQQWAAGSPDRITVHHATNQGKAAGILTGFHEAKRRGLTHAITIDTDGQHQPEDLPALKQVASANPDAIVVGARPARIDGYPWSGRVGRAISNALVFLESGLRVRDSQSGMRIYPIASVLALNCRAGRYAFETEVLVRAGWAGIPVIESPISCLYLIPSGRVTHFRRGRDTLASAAMHMRLITQSLLPWRPVARIHPQAVTNTALRRLLRWLSPRGLAHLASGSETDRRRLAASVGVGLVMATLPLYGIKTALCLALAALLRLHPLAVVGVSSLSTPPIGLLFAAASIFVGHLLLHGSAPVMPSSWSDTEALGKLALEWIVGSIPTAAVLGLAGYGLVRAGLLLRPAKP